jgi:hypothetical protein
MKKMDLTLKTIRNANTTTGMHNFFPSTWLKVARVAQSTYSLALLIFHIGSLANSSIVPNISKEREHIRCTFIFFFSFCEDLYIFLFDGLLIPPADSNPECTGLYSVARE